MPAFEIIELEGIELLQKQFKHEFNGKENFARILPAAMLNTTLYQTTTHMKNRL